MATREQSRKHDFRMYIRRYTSPNENFEYGSPHSNALLQFCLNLEHWELHKAARHPTRCDVINDVKLFLTVYGRIYSRKFMTLSSQTSHYKIKCIRNENIMENSILLHWSIYVCYLFHDIFKSIQNFT